MANGARRVRSVLAGRGAARYIWAMSHNALIAEIETWLIGEALGDPDIVSLFDALCRRLHGVGVPVERAALTWPTLHPLFSAEQVFWWLDRGAKLEQYYHSQAGSEAFRASPFQFVLTHGLPRLRRRLTGPGALTDFEVLEDFAAQGYTDYLMTVARFRIAEFAEEEERATGIMASWATKRDGGFTDADLDALSRIQTVFAVACRAAISKRVMTNLANAYLGPTAGWRVLSGDIRRGDGDMIPAVVWFSDLRGSTRLSDQMAAGDYLALLNRYFECTAAPVIEHGGEILNFIGDGVLGIFPVDANGGAAGAARQAAAAARASLSLCAEAVAAGTPAGAPLEFGIGLDMGELMFGNIGVPHRLAFSGIGRVVNGVQRIEKATKAMGQRVLATAAVAEAAPDSWVRAGSHCIDDFQHKVELYGLKAAEAKAAE
ncbi:MAG TPA: adenylate/guanylate cyclase domain-containing protein [Thermohalobaculum sp.]|nr:adenylate/guanylate cyclase domain-containing protein [Thermohalobaculum sp.]